MSTLRVDERTRATGLRALVLGLTLLLAAGVAAIAAQDGPRVMEREGPSAAARDAGDGPRGGGGVSAISQAGPDVSPRSEPGPMPARNDSGGGGNSQGSNDHSGHGGHGGGHGGGYHGGHGGHYGGHSYGWWGSFGFGWPYYSPYPYYYPYPYSDPYRYSRYNSRQGALDLDVAPGNTEVYIDGQYAGKVDSFDGWPEYLWLDEGSYDIAFYLQGFKTNARQITVRRGLVIDIDFKMESGESIRPEDLPTKSHERRDARLEQDREMRERAARGERPGDQDWRDRVRDRRGEQPRAAEPDDMADDRDDAERPEGTIDARGEPGKVRLDVEPGDASVYLDGRFIGTGDEIARMREGLLVNPGEHVLSAVRPGRRGMEKRFTATAGQEVEVDLTLEPESR